MSVTHTPACTVKGCPAPRDPDWHVPICGHGLEGHHHHVTKRSQGGKDGPQVFICPDCHEKIDSGPWGNDVKDIPGRGLVYFAWDLHGKTLIEREVMPDGVPSATMPELRSQPRSIDQREVGRDAGRLSAAAEGGVETTDVGGHQKERTHINRDPVAPSSAAAPSAGTGVGGVKLGEGAPAGFGTMQKITRRTKEESDGQSDGTRIREGLPKGQARGDTAKESRPDIPVGDDSGRTGGSRRSQRQPSDIPLTHEQRVAKAQEIARSKGDHPWQAGDTANQWVAELGEDAWQYIDTCPYECMEPPEPCPTAPHRHTALGYTIPALSNAMRVCERIPPASRNGHLSHGHHTVVYTEDAEEREAWLERCVEEDWSVREFRRQVKGTKSRLLRWTFGELEDNWKDWSATVSDTDGKAALAFLGWICPRG